ncbi:MAG: phosphoenolpyruvate synthase [Planctomycetota bacterium]|nr:MAG: phosphoenolpyruvate synthase [Planctomycetota bacterium]
MIIDSSTESSVVGGKAAALAALAAEGLPVPPFFVVLPAAYGCQDPSFQAELISRARALGGVLAVRSSAIDEDGSGHSFAGQLDSFLRVSPEDVPDQVAAVWASGFSERALAYRAERGLGPPAPPAVLVQLLVEADCAGVAFSADPVSGRHGVAVVSAVRGLGDALVSGEQDGDGWWLQRDGSIIQRTISGDDPCMDDASVLQVAALARTCAARRGRPQDIEWAMANGQLWLLQSRPITALASPDPDAPPALWDNSNIAESYGGVSCALTYSFARRAYEAVYREFCRLLGVSEAVLAANDNTFRAMIGMVEGRIYYDLLNWYRVLAMLPGYASNRAFMEQMMGVKEPLPPELVPAQSPGSRWTRLRDRLRLARVAAGLLWRHWRLGSDMAAFRRRLDDAMAPPPVPLEQQRADELAAHYRDLEERLLTRWDAPLVNDFFAMIWYGLLRALCRKWLGDTAGTLQNDLVGGGGGVISAEPARLVREMAGLLKDDPDLAATLRDAPLASAMAAVRAHPALAAALQAYLERFGDRCLEELKLESPTLEDDPSSLLRAIGHFAAREHANTSDHASAARAQAELTVAERLSWQPFRRWIFGWVLGHARARVRDRENLRFERTRLFGRVRRIVVELGRRLYAAQRLDDPRDVFHLTLDEVLGSVDGTTPCADLAGLARVRRAEYERCVAAPPPPDRCLTRGALLVSNPLRPFSTAPAPDLSGDVRSGTGCCPGVVRGTARVVRDPRGVSLPAGSILLAERTDPGWIMLFPAAAGLVVERGSLLSHSAIVARELGLPAVVGLAHATEWIADGASIEIDGSTGVVRILP